MVPNSFGSFDCFESKDLTVRSFGREPVRLELGVTFDFFFFCFDELDEELFDDEMVFVFLLGSRVGVSVGRLFRLLEACEPSDDDLDSSFLLNDMSESLADLERMDALEFD